MCHRWAITVEPLTEWERDLPREVGKGTVPIRPLGRLRPASDARELLTGPAGACTSSGLGSRVLGMLKAGYAPELCSSSLLPAE